MNIPWRSILAAVSLASAPFASAEHLAVLADPRFESALREIAAPFAEHTGFDVRFSFASAELPPGPPAPAVEVDLVFPASESVMAQWVAAGLVDVALKRNILLLPPDDPSDENAEPRYASAAVLAQTAHRLPAMAFLEFIASDDARAAFARHGFGLP